MSARTPSSRELRQRLGEVGADEAHGAGDLGRELGEALARERVAVDRDQRALGPRRSAISRAWPPPPNVQSIAVCPGRGSSRSISSPASTGMCVEVVILSRVRWSR